jgi:hypothetical protein
MFDDYENEYFSDKNPSFDEKELMESEFLSPNEFSQSESDDSFLVKDKKKKYSINIPSF